MTETEARHVLLLQAVEAADSGGATTAWTADDVAWASAAARRELGEQAGIEAFLLRRAQVGLRRLGERAENWRRLLEHRAGGGVWFVLLLAAAFFIGIAGDSFTALRRVDLLPQTLLTVLLLAWNGAVYAALLLAALRRADAGTRPRGLVRWLAVVSERLAARAGRRGVGADRAHVAAVATRFAALWSALTHALQQHRAMALLHAGAALLTLGVVASMYLRGLVFDYRAGWDSTFLDGSHVQALLGAVLGPASALSGIALPDAAALARLRWADGGGEGAARWIHLFALTLLAAVVLPRLLLAGWAAWRAQRAAAQLALPLDDPYFVRLKHAAQATPQPVTVLTYSYQLGAVQQASLAASLVELFGAGVQPRLAASLPLGAEDDIAQALPAEVADMVVALFALTATPERETHGAFASRLAGALPPRCTLHLVIDESGFRTTLGGGSEAESRVRQRRSAWEHLLQDLSLPPPHFVNLALGGPA